MTLWLLAASIFLSLTKKYSTISQPRPALKPYHYFFHGLNSLFIWFQRRVWWADGIASWWHNTMFDWHQEGWIGEGYFHLLQAPFGAAVAKKHHPRALSWSSVMAGAAQAPYWLLLLQQWWSCQCDVIMMHCELNSLIDTINDNKFLFNYITLLHIMLANCCMPWRQEWYTGKAMGQWQPP